MVDTATLQTLAAAAGDTNATRQDIEAALDEVVSLFQVYGGWVALEETFTYASATTITVASDATTRFQKGDRIKVVNDSIGKYFVVVGVASATLTVTGGDDYSLVSGAITAPYISRAPRPFGFPSYFGYTPTFTQSGAGTWTVSAAETAAFYIDPSGFCFFSVEAYGTVATATPDSLNFTVPVAMAAGFVSEAFTASCLDAGKNAKYINGHAAKWTGTVIGVRIYDATQWSGGSGRGFVCTGRYSI